MKLLISKPEMTEGDHKYARRMSTIRDLFINYLYHNDIYLCRDHQHTRFEWNDFHNHYDINIFDIKDRGDNSVKIEKVVEFLEKEYTIKVADYFYDYEMDKRRVCGVRIWLYPKE
jgi:hypothetical protein